MEPKVAVIGTIFIDCKGFAKSQYNPHGRNLGYTKFVHGGVGRNVVENLAYLSTPTYFVSAVDKSALGQEVVNRLRKSNVNLDYLTYVDTEGMGMWLAVLDQNGNLAGSISQMPNLDILEKHIYQKGKQILESSSHIVLELDLNSNISRTVVKLAKTIGKPVYGIPGNLEVILKNTDLLSSIDCFICNDIEASKLIGTDVTKMEVKQLENELVNYVTAVNITSMVITLGERGSVYHDSKNQESGYQPIFATELTDSSGAGDAFFSGTVMGLVRNRPLSEAVVYGTKIASWTIQVEENTSSALPNKMRESALFKNILANIGQINQNAI